MGLVKNWATFYFSINIVRWTISFSMEFVVGSSDVSDPTTQSFSTSEVSESTPTKKSTEKQIQPLPGKDDTFYDIRLDKKIFVDKTPFIEELLNDESSCALFTRPRHFGKSNFLQMLEAFFTGKKDLFEGTRIYHRGNTDEANGEWKEYPVVYLDFESIADFEGQKPSIKLFENHLSDTIQDVADKYKLGDCEKRWPILLMNLRAKFGLPVVVLIDEYDRPFTNEITKDEGALLHEMGNVMEQIFYAIKSSIETGRVRLACITGVEGWPLDTLIGEGAENVVTLEDKYWCMVGFTENEILEYFGPHIDKFAKTENTSSKQIIERLFKMYGDYSFSKTGRTAVVNPASLIQCLANEKFGNY